MSVDFIARAAALRTSNRLASAVAGEGAALVGFVATQAGAVSRTVDSKLRDVVSVKDFGAKGDGVTDDTAAFAAALASGRAVYVPPNAPAAGNQPQVPYMVSEIVLPNGGALFGEYGASYIRQIAGSNKDLLRLAGQNVSNWRVSGLWLDGNRRGTGTIAAPSGGNTSGRGVNIIGNTAGLASYNVYGGSDPGFVFEDVLVFDTAGDGVRFAGAVADGTAMRGGHSAIRNVNVLWSGERGAYFAINDVAISRIEVGVTGWQGIEFDEACGNPMVSQCKAYITGWLDKTKGEGMIVGGTGMFLDMAAQATPGHGFKLQSFTDGMLSFRCMGVGYYTGFGSQPAQLYVDGNSKRFRAVGNCNQTGLAPAVSVDVVNIAATTVNSIDIDIRTLGTYANELAGATLGPQMGGNVRQSIVLNGKQMLGSFFAPVAPWGNNPDTGWLIYCDSTNGNVMTLRDPSGNLSWLTTRDFTIAGLPALTSATIHAVAYVTNAVATPTPGAVPSATGTLRYPVYWDKTGLGWKYM